MSHATLAAVGKSVFAWIPDAEAQAFTTDVPPLADADGTWESPWQVALSRFAPSAPSLVASALPAEVLTKTRDVWPNPWATRLFFAGEGHPRLLRLTLRADAIWLVVRGNMVNARDASGNELELSQLSAASERVVGIYVAAPESDAGGCDVDSQRAMFVTNPNAVESWSLGTEVEVARALSDAAAVEGLLAVARTCPLDQTVSQWQQAIACADYPNDAQYGDFTSGLARAAAEYYPGASQLAQLGDVLRADLRAWQESPLSSSGQQPRPVVDGGDTDGGDGGGLDGGGLDGGGLDGGGLDGGGLDGGGLDGGGLDGGGLDSGRSDAAALEAGSANGTGVTSESRTDAGASL